MTPLRVKVQQGLDECRILVLVVQLLAGFQFIAFFYDTVQPRSPGGWVLLSGLGLLVAALAAVMAPGAHHRLVERGGDSRRLVILTIRCTALTLAPLGAALAMDVLLVVGRVLGVLAVSVLAGILAAAGLLAATLLWRFPLKKPEPEAVVDHIDAIPLKDRIGQVMTESRVVLPGTQALLGFQFTATLTAAFQRLPHGWQVLHVVALLLVAGSMVALLVPTAYHRLVLHGEDTEAVHAVASAMVLVAMGLLAAGLAGDLALVTAMVAGTTAGIVLGVACLIGLLSVWYLWPLWCRWRDLSRSASRPASYAGRRR